MPMTRLSDIVGHDHGVGILRRSLAEGRLHHSLLFSGPEAVGKRTVAVALAAALNCPHATDDACGACPSCHKVDKGIHPDVMTLTLEKTVIPIDAVRRLRQEASYRPYEGARRVFIVDPADRMSTDAQNALLKTLEEPSPGSAIILVTARPMHLLPTTRSRCQSIAFGTLPARALAADLVRLRGLDEDAAFRAARIAEGRYGAALTLDLAEHDALRAEMLELLGRLAEQHPRDHVIADAESFGTDPESIGRRLAMLSGLARDILLLCSGTGPDALLHTDIADDLADLAGRLAGGPEPAGALIDRMRLAARDLERNVNRRLLVETMLFDLAAARSGGAALPAR